MSQQRLDDKTIARFRPDDCLVGVIRQAVAEHRDIAVSLPGSAGIRIFPFRGECFNDGADLEALCRAPADRLDVRPVGPAAQSAARPRPLADLLWEAGFHASAGRLMEGCFHYDVVSLPHWPNLTRLPITPNTMRICALLTRHPTSIMLAHRLLRIDAQELYRFYSAATCAGSVKVLNRRPQEASIEEPEEESAEPVTPAPQSQRFFSLLFAKLVGG